MRAFLLAVAAAFAACLDFEHAVERCLEVGRCLPPDDAGAPDGGVDRDAGRDAGSDAGSDAGCLPPHGFSPCDAGVCGLRWKPLVPCADDAPFQLSAAPGTSPRVAAKEDGSGFLAVWTETDDSGGQTVIRGVHLSARQFGSPFAAPPDAGAQASPDVSFEGGQGVVVYSVDGGAIFAQRLGVDATPFKVAQTLGGIPKSSVASGGGFHLVVWVEAFTNGPDAKVMARFLPAKDPPLSPQVLGFARRGSRPTVAFTGSDFLVAWEGPAGAGEQIQYLRFPLPQNDGGASTSYRLPFVAPHFSPAAACLASTCVLTWTTSCDAGQCIRSARLEGAMVQQMDLVAAPSAQTGNGIAALLDGYAVAWLDSRPMAPGVYGTGLKPDGGVQQVNGVPLVRTTGAVGDVSVACHQDVCLLVYEQR